MAAYVQHPRSTVTGNMPPGSLPIGVIAVNFPDKRLTSVAPGGVIVNLGRRIEAHDPTLAYKQNDIIIDATNQLRRCLADIPPKAFTAGDWADVSPQPDMNDVARKSQANTFTAAQTVQVADDNYALIVNGATNALRVVPTPTTLGIWARTANNAAYAPLVVAATSINLAAPTTINGVDTADYARRSVGNNFVTDSNFFGNPAVDAAVKVLVKGPTAAIRIGSAPNTGSIDAVDATGSASYKSLALGGSDFSVNILGVNRLAISSGSILAGIPITVSFPGDNNGIVNTNNVAGVSTFMGAGGAAGRVGTSTNHPFQFYANNVLSGHFSAAGHFSALNSITAQGNDNSQFVRASSGGSAVAGDAYFNANCSGIASWSWGVRRALGAPLVIVASASIDGASPLFSFNFNGDINMLGATNVAIQRDGNTKTLFLKGGVTGSQIVVSGSAHPTQASYNYYDANWHAFRLVDGTETVYIDGQGKLTCYSGRFNVRGIGGDPASPVDGDLWYNSAVGKFRVRAGGITQDLH